VHARHVYLDGIVADKCFNNVVIETATGELLYAESGTRDVSTIASPQPCRAHSLPVFKRGGEYFNARGRVHVQASPAQLVAAGRHLTPQPLVFNATTSALLAPVYDLPTLTNVRHMLFEHRAARQRIDNLVAYQAGRSYFAEDVLAFLNETENVLVDGLTGIIALPWHTLDNVIDAIFTEPVQLAVTIIVLIAVLVAVIWLSTILPWKGWCCNGSWTSMRIILVRCLRCWHCGKKDDRQHVQHVVDGQLGHAQKHCHEYV